LAIREDDCAGQAGLGSLRLHRADLGGYLHQRWHVGQFNLDPATLGAGGDLVDLLVACGLAPSKGLARRLVGEGAVSVNGERFDGERPLGTADLLAGDYVLLRRGKRLWGAVRVAAD